MSDLGNNALLTATTGSLSARQQGLGLIAQCTISLRKDRTLLNPPTAIFSEPAPGSAWIPVIDCFTQPGIQISICLF